jgi:HPt (histidine-containing phosphotransfer) domain-containing protein
MGDGAAVVIDLFQKQTADLLAHMRAAIQATDPTTLRENAHKLKGGCLTLAATQMAEHCEKLEACARKGTTDGTTALVDQIETDFAVALAALNAHTNNI